MATLQVANNIGTGSYHGLTATLWYGEYFTPQNSFMLTLLKFRAMKHPSSYSGYVTVKVYKATVGYQPFGDLLASANVNVSSLTTYPSSSFYSFDLSAFNVFMCAGNRYLFYIESPSGTGAFTFYGGDDPDGHGIKTGNAGASWTSDSDMKFEVWGNTVNETITTDSVTPGVDDAVVQASLTGSETIDEYGFDYTPLTANEPDTWDYEETVSGSPSSPFHVTMSGLAASAWYWCRPKVHLSSYGWLYGSASIFQCLINPLLIKYQENTGPPSAGAQYTTWQYRSYCTFTPIFGHALKTVKVYLYKDAALPNGIVYVSIHATSANKPTGAALVTATMPTSELTTSPVEYHFGFGAGITVQAATTYAIVVHCSVGSYPSPELQFSKGGSYATGGGRSQDYGSSWIYDGWYAPFSEWGSSGVETYEATDIQAFSAQGNGFLLDETDITKVAFEWGTESGVYTDEEVDESGTYFPGLFGFSMTGLSALTHYYYRAKIYHTTYGWLYGNEMEFTTTRASPRVRTDPPSDCQPTYIEGVGYIVSIGAENCDQRGFVISLSSHSRPDEDTAPADSGYDSYVSEDGDFGVGSFTLTIPNLDVSRIYYYRAWAHNSYGYHYGEELIVLTNPDVNILYPTSDASKGIRFDSGPGGHWPNRLADGEQRTPHYLLLRSKDCTGEADTFGYITGGGYIYERQCYGSALYTDLYGLANPWRREESILKVKWKANIMSNTYPGANTTFRKLYTHSTLYTGSALSASWPDGSYECEIFSTNPYTSAAWTLDEVDNLQAGIELGNDSGWGTPACDWLCCYVLWANAAVRTDTAEKIASDTLRMNGYVLQDEAEECEVYFEYGLTDSYGSSTTPQVKRMYQFFSADVSGLDPLETYHYRAVIETACGETFYGEDTLFNMYRPDRIYAWLGDSAEDESVELTDPDYPMVLYARTERGWDEELAQASAGIAELTCDNYYGDFNPENNGGQYYGDLVLGKWLTVYEMYKGVKYPHFTGKITKILPNDDPNDPTAYILAADGMDDISQTQISTVLRQDTDVGELADDALDACAWAAGKRDIDTGVDTLEFGWFHKRGGLEAFRDLELTEKGRFFIKRNGDARFENRHYRITGDGLVSQATFDNTAIRIQYEWSKRLLYNDIQVTGRRYTAGGVQLFSGYDMATIESALVWSAHTGDAAAPYIPQGTTVTLWAEFNQPLSSYDTLVKGTHWNANESPDKTGTDLSDNITITVTQYGQALKLAIENTGSMGAYIVEPDSPPDSAEDKTLLIYGVLFGSENVTVIEEDTDSQDDYGKRSLSIDAPFKSRPNDVLAYAQWLLARYHLPVPNPVQVAHIARAGWPDDTIRIQCLVREISDRITVASTKLGFDRDFYINKVIQEYAQNGGGMEHQTTWVVEQAEGSAEGLYWLLGVEGFGELGEATVLGF
jgi:hypothetical protein